MPVQERGAMLIQLLVTIVIIGVLTTIVSVSLSSARTSQALQNSVEEVISALSEARSRTLAGENDSQYGVHLESSRVVIFVGPSYSAGISTNKVVDLDSAIVLASIALNGGGSEVLFDQLTGDTNQYGTLIVKRSTTTEGQKTVTITKTGLASSN